MEDLLHKLAKQLDAIDEASLLVLWDKYAQIVNNFEPSERWQEATLILSFIQAKLWKNQLFNTHWSDMQKPSFKINPNLPNFDFSFEEEKPQVKAVVLDFKKKKD